MERGSDPGALRLQAVEVRDGLARSRFAHVDAVCFQMAPRIVRHDHAPEIASSDHKDVGSGSEDRREIPDCEV
jgi:hypothetical protein